MGDESTVRVAVRIRPQIARELIDMCRICTSVTPGEPQVWLGSDKAFTYDYLFDTPSIQEEVYSTCVEGLVEGCFDGYNATVLAYGQTGSGKTYTMGTGLEMDCGPDGVGIIPRAVHHLFNGVDTRKEKCKEDGTTPPDFKISAHFMELYNEDIIDLLDPGFKEYNKGKVKIHEDSDGEIYVTGITTKTVVSVEDALECLRSGALSRTTGSTNMNTQSSRSHAIFTLIIRQQRLAPLMDPDNPTEVPELETLTAKFHFVDLAGSERLKRTGATGDRAREGISINCGLLALGNVISALGDISKKALHVPYRDSKLTRLLQDSLGGNSRTLMIACVSPSDTDFMETLNTLKYANRARNIKNKVTVNQDKSSRTIAFLRQEIQELRIELMEFKQGKRVIGENGNEAINDMFHENQMLSTEVNNLRIRIKALQDTIEMMTTQNTNLLAEKTMGQWGEGGENSDMATVIHNHLREIEELKSKLCESESHCEHLQKQLANKVTSSPMKLSMVSSTTTVPMSGSFIIEDEEESLDINDLLKKAKEDVKSEMEIIQRKKKVFDTPENDEDDNYDSDDEVESSDDSDEDKENYDEELADLTSEISIKQKLIESLESTQRKLEGMKHQYEEKLNTLMNRIKATQDERDKVLLNIRQRGGPQSGGDDKVKTVRQDYQRKLSNMEEEMKKLKNTLRDHQRLMKERAQHERQLKTMKAELSDMKKTKVKLLNKMKDETNRAKKEDLKKNKEIAQLRKEQRKKENYIRNLEADNRLKKAVLRRKTEELSNMKKAPRVSMRNRLTGKVRRGGLNAEGGFSPKVAKHKWQSLEQAINKVAYNKQTISSLERDMNRWLRERETLSKQLEKVRRKKERSDPADTNACTDLNDQMEALKANIDYILENIRECQENIVSMEESKELEASTLLNADSYSSGADELQYLVAKLTTMSVNHATIAAERQAAIAELEGKLKQMEQTTSVQEQLLAHVLRDNDMNVYHLMTSLVAGDDHSPGSTESSRSSSPVDCYRSNETSSSRRTDKARRKQATTEDMLFERKSRERSLSASTNILSGPDNLALRQFATKTNDSHSAPPTLDPRMTTSLEGSLGQRTFDPNSKSSSSSNYSLKGASQAILGPAVLNLPKDMQFEVTPPTSPIAYRRAISKEDNVFSRLTSTTASYRESSPNMGRINPYSGKVSQKSVLACTHVAQGHSKAVLSVHATDDLIFSASKDRTVKVWDLRKGKEILSLNGHPNNVNCVKYSESLRTVFSVSSSCIKVWDIRENPVKCTKTLTSSGLTSSGPVNYTANSRTLQMPPGETLINDISLSDRNDILYSAAGNIVRIWDLRKFMSVGKLAGSHQAAIMCLAVDSDRQKDVVITGSKDHYVKVFDVGINDTGLVSPRYNLDPPHYDGIQSLALYGTSLFSGSRDMCIKKWDLARGEMSQSVNNAHRDWICALRFLPGGQIVLSGCRSGVIKMWSADTCQIMGTLRAHASPINAITTNSTCIFTASSDCTIGLWRMRASYDISPELSDAA